MKKILAFDIDDTLAVTKSPIDDRMAEALIKVAKKFQICIISGGKFEQFLNQIIDRLNVEEKFLTQFHLMPTCGTQYYTYSLLKKNWQKIYSQDLSLSQRKKIILELEKAVKSLNYWPKKTYGEIIEDRGTQVTYSALGQNAPAELKYKYDPDGTKRLEIKKILDQKLDQLEVRIGGTTSIDITFLGIDKAFGMKKLIESLKIKQEEILFFGDKLQPGGNDYPVKAMGIDSIEVNNWQETVNILETINVLTI